MDSNVWVVIISIAVNIAAVAFFFGKLSQSVNELTRRVTNEEVTRKEDNVYRNNKVEKWQERMESRQPEVLPECTTQFNNINTSIHTLEGKVDILIKLMKSNKRRSNG